MVTNKLESGNRGKAMKRLRVPPFGQSANPWTVFRLGLFVGLFICLSSVAVLAGTSPSHFLNDSIYVLKCLDCLFFTAYAYDSPQRADWLSALRIYRSVFLVLLLLFFLGINTYGWRASGVNHVLIFELNPRDNLAPQELLEVNKDHLIIT